MRRSRCSNPSGSGRVSGAVLERATFSPAPTAHAAPTSSACSAIRRPRRLLARGGYGSQRIVPGGRLGRAAERSEAGRRLQRRHRGARRARRAAWRFHGRWSRADMARGLTPRPSTRCGRLSDPARASGAGAEAFAAARARTPRGRLPVRVRVDARHAGPSTTGAVLPRGHARVAYRLDRLLLQLRQAGAFEPRRRRRLRTMATCPARNGWGRSTWSAARSRTRRSPSASACRGHVPGDRRREPDAPARHRRRARRRCGSPRRARAGGRVEGSPWIRAGQ